MPNYTYNDELYHYGVKGMKWKNHRYLTDENGNPINRPMPTGRRRNDTGQTAYVQRRGGALGEGPSGPGYGSRRIVRRPISAAQKMAARREFIRRNAEDRRAGHYNKKSKAQEHYENVMNQNKEFYARLRKRVGQFAGQARDLYERGSKEAGRYYESAKRGANEFRARLRKKVKSTYDEASRNVKDASKRAKNLYDDTSRGVTDFYNKSSKKAREAYNSAKDAYNKGSKKAREEYDKRSKKVKEAYDYASKEAGKVAKKAKDTYDKATEQNRKFSKGVDDWFDRVTRRKRRGSSASYRVRLRGKKGLRPNSASNR